MNYHAHVYWRNASERESALSIRPNLKEIGCYLGAVHDRPIGPHPLPMYQALFDDNIKNEVENILLNLKSPILIHESIKDDLRDHTEGATWMNEKLPLNLSIFGGKE